MAQPVKRRWVEKQLHPVAIAGIPIKLRSTHDRETVNELIRVVNDKVEEVKSNNQQVSPQNAVMLAALHLAEDLLSTKRTTRQGLHHLEEQAKEILSDLKSSTISQQVEGGCHF